MLFYERLTNRKLAPKYIVIQLNSAMFWYGVSQGIPITELLALVLGVKIRTDSYI